MTNKTEQQPSESAITFLRKKGILAEFKTQWIVKYPDGKEFDLVKLLDEYKALQPASESVAALSEEDRKRLAEWISERWPNPDNHSLAIGALIGAEYEHRHMAAKQAELVVGNQKLREYITAEREISQRFTDENAKLRSERDKMREEIRQLQIEHTQLLAEYRDLKQI